MILLTQIAGFLLIGLAVLHAIFPRYFGWKTDLRQLRLINRQMMEVHTFFIALTVGLMGILCIVSADELSRTKLGRTVSAGFALFWGARLVVQFFWYSPKLWRGKPFETVVHIVFAILWAGLTLLFALLAFGETQSMRRWPEV
ncbi:MAG: hypothetical protein AAF357_17610 [Verrucomicrobiota bacterium]